MAADDAASRVSFVGRDPLDRRLEEGALLERERVAIAKVIDVAALFWKGELNLNCLCAFNIDVPSCGVGTEAIAYILDDRLCFDR